MKRKYSSTTLMLGGAGLIVLLLIGAAIWKNYAPSKYDEFAQCLNDKGVTEYVAYWCGACAQQKELFGSAYRHLNTVECSSPGSQTFDLCPDITSTPTWEGPDGERITGVRTLEQLSEEYGCELPE